MMKNAVTAMQIPTSLEKQKIIPSSMYLPVPQPEI
jgi:hypothetical protein